jgi:hypothetical protein
VTQVVECLSGKLEALSSNPTIRKKKKEKEKKERKEKNLKASNL